MQEQLAKKRQLMGNRYKVTSESLLIKFLRFLVLKLPQGNLRFNISKDYVGQKSTARWRVNKSLKISVKDPFLTFENHGYWLKDKERFQKLIYRLKYFLIETS